MRPTFKKSAETTAITEYLASLPLNQEVSFVEASRAVGFLFTSTTPAYQSAKRAAERDHNVVISTVRGYGFKRINGVGMVERATSFFRRVRKGSRREAHVQEIAIMSNLPRETMLAATEQLSRLRILESTSVGAKKALSNKAAQEMPPLVGPMTATAGRRR